MNKLNKQLVCICNSYFTNINESDIDSELFCATAPLYSLFQKFINYIDFIGVIIYIYIYIAIK